MSYRDREDFARETGETLRTIRGMVRRFVVTLTSGLRWQALGIRSPTGGDEVVQLETFPGIGFYARPASSGKPEAIAVAISGAAKARVIIASRDADAQATAEAALADGELAEGETLVYTPTGVIHMRANGTVEIRSLGGTAKELATKQDVEELRNWAEDHTHPGNGSKPDPPSPPNPSGTTVLKAE